MTLTQRIDALSSTPAGRAALARSVARAEASVALATPRGTARGRGQSSKAKGRAGAQMVKRLLVEHLGIREDALLVKATSMPGVDVYIAPEAQAKCPMAIEAKAVEALNIWAALAQAAENATPGLTPVVFFKRARTPMFAALPATDLLAMQRALNELRGV